MARLFSRFVLVLILALQTVRASPTRNGVGMVSLPPSSGATEAVVAANLLRSSVPSKDSPSCPVVLSQDEPVERLSMQLRPQNVQVRRDEQYIAEDHLADNGTTRRELTIVPRIIGGQFASPRLQNYMVALYSPGFKTICSGTLLSPKWVLTAAHCDITTRHVVTVGKAWTLGLGRAAERRATGTFPVRRVFKHPQFEPFPGAREYRFDVAVVEIEGGTTEASQYMRLNDDAALPLDTAFLRTAGYGTTAADGGRIGLRPMALRQVDMPVVPHAACQARYGTLSAPEKIWAKNQICAGYTGRDCDTCVGDSGGPLVRYAGSEAVLVGTTSFGVRCGHPLFPSVFTRVTGLARWLRSTAAEFHTGSGVVNGPGAGGCPAGDAVFAFRRGVEFCRPCADGAVSAGGGAACERCPDGLVRSAYNGARCSCKGWRAAGKGLVAGKCRKCRPGTYSGVKDEVCKACPAGTRAWGWGKAACEPCKAGRCGKA